MIHKKARTLRRHGGGARPVPWGQTRATGPDVPPLSERVLRSDKHKQTIMDELIRYPAGLSTAQLSELLGLAPQGAYNYVSQLEAEGFVGHLGGKGAGARWVADV